MNGINTILLESGRQIGPGCPCFIVAEIGNNHQGELSTALEMIDAAADAGADAVKFQKRDMACMFTCEGLDAPYTGPNSFGPTYGEHREALELSIEEMAAAKAHAEQRGIVFFASPWDDVSLAQLLELDMEVIKISSADLVNVPFLRKCARSGKPIILSTGMSSWDDVDLAVSELKRFTQDIIILHCNSSYPCPDTDIGLPVMDLLRKRYHLPVGYSGHETDLGPSIGAAALGACIVERHFTLDKAQRGTDHQVSLDPGQLTQMVSLIRQVEAAMTGQEKLVYPAEAGAAKKLRKSIVLTRDLPAGHIITEEDLTAKCPGNGISPARWDAVLGKVLSRSVKEEEQLSWDILEEEQLKAAEA